MIFLWLIGFSFLCGSAANAVKPPDDHHDEYVRFGDMLFPRKRWNSILENRALLKSQSARGEQLKANSFRNGDITLWENATVHYYFDENEQWPGDSLQKIRKYIEEVKEIIHSTTCVKLVEKKAGYFKVKIINGDEGQPVCYSILGVDGLKMPQKLSLHHSCANSFRTVAHEYLHLLGLEHTHSRYDRDDYVQIHWNNIKEDYKGNYEEAPEGGFKMTGTPYDFASIMSYTANADAKGDLLAMSPKHEKEYTYTMGATEIAFSDLLTVNKLYSCFDSKVNAGLKCKNGGFPSPTVKGKCVCPAAFDDTNDCGDPPSLRQIKPILRKLLEQPVIPATKTWFNYTIRSHTPKEFVRFRERLRIRRSNASDVVGIRLKQFNMFPGGYEKEFCSYSCRYGYLEIKNSRQHEGIRLCCPETSYRMFTSTLETSVVRVKSLHKDVIVEANFEFGLIW